MPKQLVNLKSTEFQPKNDYILVAPAKPEQERKTAGGIIIPDLDKSVISARPTSGDVVSLGPDIDDIKVDAFVIWPGTDGLDIEFNDGDFILLRYKSIIGMKKSK